MSVFALLDPAVHLAHDAVSALAQLLPTALAIVLFTVCVRLALHPLARASARGEKTRLRLAPQVTELNRKHKGKPEKLQAALTELYRAEKSSPLAGCLPMLIQIPFFSVMYRLFTTPNDLLGHTVLGVPLGLHVGSAHGPAQLLVFGALYGPVRRPRPPRGRPLPAHHHRLDSRRTRLAAPRHACGGACGRGVAVWHSISHRKGR